LHTTLTYPARLLDARSGDEGKTDAFDEKREKERDMTTDAASGWIIICTERFEETVTFFRDVMGFAVLEEGVPVIDTQFTRYAQIGLPNGMVLEIVEPGEQVRHLYTAPILSITVDDVLQARRTMENKQTEFVAPIFDTKQGWGWTYFRAPDGHVYQIQGPYKN
jgi:catechol 2,3-dioxygenase-like lactoylglutathione lyase family enzyme